MVHYEGDKPIVSKMDVIQNRVTTNDEYTLVHEWNTRLISMYKFTFEAADNDLTIKLIYSLDGIVYEDTPIIPEFSVAVGAPVYTSLANYASKIQILVKPTNPGNNGTLTTRLIGTNLQTGLMYGKASIGNLPLSVDANGYLNVNTDINVGDVTVSGEINLNDGVGNPITSTTTSSKQRLDVADGGGTLTVDGPLTDAQLTTQALAKDSTLTLINNKITECNTGSVTLTGSLPDTTALDLAHIHTKVDNIIACNTGAVTISSSALPAGASTSDAQTTGNNSLSSIDGKITACNTGAIVGAVSLTGNLPDTVASDLNHIHTKVELIPLDTRNGGVVTTDSIHSKLHIGQVYTIGSLSGSIAKDSSFIAYIKTPAIKKIHARLTVYGSDTYSFTIHEGVTVSNPGTALPVINLDRNSANTSGLLHYHTPSITGVGTVINLGYLGSADYGIGGDYQFNETILKLDTGYTVTLTAINRATFFTSKMIFWEEP